MVIRLLFPCPPSVPGVVLCYFRIHIVLSDSMELEFDPGPAHPLMGDPHYHPSHWGLRLKTVGPLPLLLFRASPLI